MLIDLSDDILCEIIDYLEKPRTRRLAPSGHFAVVGPAWGKWRICLSMIIKDGIWHYL